MAAFLEILGEQLQGKEGNVPTVEALDGKTAVLVYFSAAHWWQGFNEKLVEFHTKHSTRKGFATVFVSVDQYQQEFDDYFRTMPWFALPFARSDIKGTLKWKHKVQDVPTVLVFGPDGAVITDDGFKKIKDDFVECADFPWRSKTLLEVLGNEFLKQDGSKVGREAVEGKTLGIYFGRDFCQPCSEFAPVLKEFYPKYKARDPNFEVIFVSQDKDKADMLDYFGKQSDYLALPFENEQTRLFNMLNVIGIPHFVVVDADGQTLNDNALWKVAAGVDTVLAQGWSPSVIGILPEGPQSLRTDINDTPSIVIMCEEAEATVQDACEQAMIPLAKKYIKEATNIGDCSDVKYIFVMAKDRDEEMQRLKALTRKEVGKALEKAGSKPVMLLLDIPDNGGFYLSTAEEITTESIAAFIHSKEEGRETRYQLGI